MGKTRGSWPSSQDIGLLGSLLLAVSLILALVLAIVLIPGKAAADEEAASTQWAPPYQADPLNPFLGTYIGAYLSKEGAHSPNDNDIAINEASVGVEIEGAFHANVYGGFDPEGLGASGNKVTVASVGYVAVLGNGDFPADIAGLADGTVRSGHVLGGASMGGDASSNIVVLGAKTVENVATEGTPSTVEGEEAEATGGGYSATIHGNVLGGLSANAEYIPKPAATESQEGDGGVDEAAPKSGVASLNQVRLEKGEVLGLIAGGGGVRADVGSNQVTVLSEGVAHGDVFGGFARIEGDALGNIVVIQGKALSYVYGGVVDKGVAQANQVQLQGATVEAGGAIPGLAPEYIVAGGKSFAGDAVSNSVTVTGATSVTGVRGVIGGEVEGRGNATGNNVYVSLADSYVLSSDVYGGSLLLKGERGGDAIDAGEGEGSPQAAEDAEPASGETAAAALDTLSGNSVRVVMTQVGSDLFGAYAEGDKAKAQGNSVSLEGVTLSQDSRVYGAYLAGGGEASGNSVAFSGKGSIAGGIYGGIVLGEGKAQGNQVSFAGESRFVSDTRVYGGHAEGGATGNLVSFSGNVVIENNASVSLYGGFAQAPQDGQEAGDGFTGNTLELRDVSGSPSFDTISNFEYYGFYLSDPSTAVPVIRAASLGLGDGANPSRLSELRIGGGGLLAPGSKITLIESAATTGGFAPTTIRGHQGGLMEYDILVGLEGDDLVASIQGAEPNPQLKSVAEAPLAAASLVSVGADLTATEGVNAATISTRGYDDMAAFSVMGGSNVKTETGSHVKVSGMAVELGVAKGFEIGGGRLVLGVFGEMGRGSYDTYNSFANASDVSGYGKLSYAGGGILARADLGPDQASRPYLEASFRMGKAKSDFSTADISNYQGEKLETKQDGAYYGAHLGVGYVMTEGRDHYELDLSAKYLFAHLDGDELMLQGLPLSLSDVSSHRLRAGGRLSYPITRYMRPYFGAYYEHEFQGDSEVTLAGMSVPQPTIKGATGIGELGISFADDHMPLKLDIGLQAYTGRKQGIGGSVKVNLAF
ncbi:MAG: autotransporter outer membrane beta-barrel domain-containing protein [Deltaproteobacteria bacterium]|jgi:hypothetical protein|nr:autotransporter outer membrane beta-barrel domain-containing protein [Deltaproteobacteria bacterium]